MIQNKKERVVIVKELNGNLVFLTEFGFLKSYSDFEYVSSVMYIKNDRLRRFTKNGITTFINKIKKRYENR